MLSFLKPTLKTFGTFFILLVLDIVVVFGGMLSGVYPIKDWWAYHIIWTAIIFEKFGVNTSGGGEWFNPSLAGLVALAIAILIDLLIIYIIAAFISKRFFEKNK